MKKTLLIFALFLVYMGSPLFSEIPGTIIIGYNESYPPYMIYKKPDERPTGIYPEIIDAAAKKIGIKVKYVQYPWVRISQAARNGVIDAVMGLFKTPDRETLYEFPANEGLIYEEYSFFTWKGSGIKYNGKLDEFKNILIGVVQDYKYGDIFDEVKLLKQNCPNGTGKELIAEAIHNTSKIKRKVTGDFVQDNIAGWTDTLFEDTIYGHVKNAFTGALAERKGRLEEAHNGTLFLDEIGDLQMSLQANLLRLLQERTYFKLGSDKMHEATARFIFATNRNINELRNKGTFRTDLFYRLEKYHIHLPPLRERKEDIPPLIDHFVKKFADAFQKEKPEIPNSLYNLLQNYDFPGNIRELESMVEVAMSFHEKGPLSIEEFVKKIREKGAEPIYIQQKQSPQPGQTIDHSILFGGEFPTYEKLMAVYTNEALIRAKNNKSKAAGLSGLPRSTFIRYWEESNSPK